MTDPQQQAARRTPPRPRGPEAVHRPAPLPHDELARLHVVSSLAMVDTPPEDAYDDLAGLAARLCGTPLAGISLLEIGRQWFKAAVGLPVRETRRDVSFCSWALLEPARTLVVPDACSDSRFAHSPLVTDAPGLRSYAGVPLVLGDQPVGTLCVLDTRPRRLSPHQLQALRVLADQVVAQFELRRTRRVTQELQRRLDIGAGRAVVGVASR